MANFFDSGGIPLFSQFVDTALKYDFWNQQNEQQDYLMQKQHAFNLDTMAKSQQYQRQNALDAGMFEKFSKQRAGLNVNSDGGFSPVAGASPVGTGAPSAPQPNAPDFSQFANMMMQVPLVRSQIALNQSQADSLAEETRGKRLHNDAIENQQNVFRALSKLISVEKDSDGKEIYFDIISPEAFESYKALKALDTWKADQVAQRAEATAREADAKLQTLIKNRQIKDDKVLQAYTNRPVDERTQILSSVVKALSEVGLNLQKIEESKENVKLMITQEQLNKIEAKIKAHENTYILLENIFGEGHDGVLSAVTLTLTGIGAVANIVSNFVK